MFRVEVRIPSDGLNDMSQPEQEQNSCGRSWTTRSLRARSCASGWPGHAEIEIVAECANGFEAVKAASELSPDLLLLDIQMPKLDGFDVLELIGDIPVIFITAYDNYAVRAFEVHAVDYLLKPFSEAASGGGARPRPEPDSGRARRRRSRRCWPRRSPIACPFAGF